MESEMPRTQDKDEADGQSSGRLPSAADERSIDDEHKAETGAAAVKRVRALDDSSDDDDVSSDGQIAINPS